MGRWAEDVASQELALALGPTWTIVRTPTLGTGTWRLEIDLALVGPPGLVIVEVKHWPRTVVEPGGRARVRRGNQWDERRSPVRQLYAQVRAVQAWLREAGLNVPVHAALLLPNTRHLEITNAERDLSPVMVFHRDDAARRLAAVLLSLPDAAMDVDTRTSLIVALTT